MVAEAPLTDTTVLTVSRTGTVGLLGLQLEQAPTEEATRLATVFVLAGSGVMTVRV